MTFCKERIFDVLWLKTITRSRPKIQKLEKNKTEKDQIDQKRVKTLKTHISKLLVSPEKHHIHPGFPAALR